MKRKPVIRYYLRGRVEVLSGGRYRAAQGYSEQTPDGRPLYPWLTKKECKQAADAIGCRAVFVDNVGDHKDEQ